MRALSRVEQWQPGTRLDSWMYRIAQNLWLDRARARKVRGEQVNVEAAEALAGTDGRDVVESRLTLQAVSAALGHLPDEQRVLIALVCIDGLSYKEAADITQTPIGTVMSRLARARRELHARLEGQAQRGGPTPSNPRSGELHMSDPPDNRPLDSPCPGAEVTDEEIMAYADGVLANERLPAVREELANNPERMKTLEAYLKTKEAMAHALGPILVATVPERLRDTIHELAAAPAPARGLGALLRSAVGGHLFAKLRVPMLAVAALCLVFLGAWLGDYAKRTCQSATQSSCGGSREVSSLSHRYSVRSKRRRAGRRPSSPIAFRSSPSPRFAPTTGSWCREFDVLHGGRPGGRSLACRGNDGAWLVPVPGVLQPKEYGVAGGRHGPVSAD